MQIHENLTSAQKYELLRKEYNCLEYIDFQYQIVNDGLHVTFNFSFDGKINFTPGFLIPRRRYFTNFPTTESLSSPAFQSLIFHIGMIELISYWKAVCPKIIIIKPYLLNDKQIAWWKNVYFHGLGEFFYTNYIKADAESFVEIKCTGKKTLPLFESKCDETVIVPIGGGKDSVVSLELLRDSFNVRPFIMNPRGATIECARVAGFGNDGFIEVNRFLDKKLLELNAAGYLNGHTPFSALLAFYSLLVAHIAGHKHIALSNESSANEPTIAGTEVNHQYSKSTSFEKDFREYVQGYLSEDFNYFSFLRPLSELQIACLFAANVKYYPVFKSCNAGSKTDSWCCNCPKCLFAFTILSPFIPLDELITIFGENLFEKPSMLPYLKELCGLTDEKPFECVGTIDEVNAALQLFISENQHKRLPLLLDYYSNTSLFETYSKTAAESILSTLNSDHFLTKEFLQVIENKFL